MDDPMMQLAMLLAGQRAPQPAMNTAVQQQAAPLGMAAMGKTSPPGRPGDPWGDHPPKPQPTKDKPKHKRHHLSPYETKVDAATVKGPSAYTRPMRRNIGMNVPTIGYGNPVEDNTSGYTKLVGLFSAPVAPQPMPAVGGQPVEDDIGQGGAGRGGTGVHPRPRIPQGFGRRGNA